MTAPTGVHDQLESAFTIRWNERSQSTGISVHVPLEDAGRALGHLLLGSPGIARDPEEAAHWLHAAIEGGDVRAWDDLASLAITREVREGYQREAYQWFLEQARSGNVVAIFNLG